MKASARPLPSKPVLSVFGSLSLSAAKATLFLGLASLSVSAKVNLPKESFPLGRPDLIETRTVKEIRPGVTHVHVVRGDLNAPAPKLRIQTAVQPDLALLAPVRDYLKKANYAVREHQSENGGYSLSAGDFDTSEDARLAALQVPYPMSEHVMNPTAQHDWDAGPYSLHIVIVDPKQYRGKVLQHCRAEYSAQAL